MNLRDFLSEHFTPDARRADWPRTILLVLLILAVFAALWQYLMPQVREIRTTTFRTVPQIREVAKVQRIYIPCPERGIVALDKAAVAKTLHMPWLLSPTATAVGKAGEVPVPPEGGTSTSDRTVQAFDPSDPSETSDPSDPALARRSLGEGGDLQVTATADLPESDSGNQVIAVFNSTTGRTDLIAKEKPAPWLQLRSDYILGLRYGLDHHLDQTGTLYSSWTFLRFKDVYLSGYSELATDIQPRRTQELRWKGQLDLQYRH